MSGKETQGSEGPSVDPKDWLAKPTPALKSLFGKANALIDNYVQEHYAALKTHAATTDNAVDWIVNRPTLGIEPPIAVILTQGYSLRVSPTIAAEIGPDLLTRLLAVLIQGRDELRGADPDLWEGVDAFEPWVRAVAQAGGFVRFNLSEQFQLDFLLAVLRIEMRVLGNPSVREWAEQLESTTLLEQGDALAAILKQLQPTPPAKMVFEGKLGIPKIEDGGQAQMFEIEGDEDNGTTGDLFVRLQSWSSTKQHPIMDSLRRHRVRIIVEVLE